MSIGNKNTYGDKLSRMRWQLAMLRRKSGCCSIDGSNPTPPPANTRCVFKTTDSIDLSADFVNLYIGGVLQTTIGPFDPTNLVNFLQTSIHVDSGVIMGDSNTTAAFWISQLDGTPAPGDWTWDYNTVPAGPFPIVFTEEGCYDTYRCVEATLSVADISLYYPYIFEANIGFGNSYISPTGPYNDPGTVAIFTAACKNHFGANASGLLTPLSATDVLIDIYHIPDLIGLNINISSTDFIGFPISLYLPPVACP